MFVSSDDGICDVGIDSDIFRGGEDPNNICVDIHRLRYWGEVVLAGKCGGIVIDVCKKWFWLLMVVGAYQDCAVA